MDRNCNFCGEPLVRKRYKPSKTSPTGKLEPPVLFERRKYCDTTCANRDKLLYRDWELAEELDFLLGTDVPDSIAKRLGYAGIDSLLNRLRENGQLDLHERVLRLHAEYLEAAI